MSPDRVDSLGVDDLTWRDVAESVWLAAIIQSDTEAESPDRTSTPPNDTGDDVPSTVCAGDERSDPASVGERGDPARSEKRPARQDADRVSSTRERVGAAGDFPPRPQAGDPGKMTTRSPVGWSLTDRLTFIRALKPLKRYVTSSRTEDVVIDEIATAERAVQDQLWWPVTRQRRERWLDLTVVIDTAPSMALWRPKVDGFVELLEQLGAFRTIRVRRLDTNRSSTGVPLSPALRGGPGDSVARDPAEVVELSGRRAALVITDGLGDAWRTDLIGPVLAQWGRAMPVSVVNVLPQWMWGRCGAALHRAWLSTPPELRPNRTWSVELPDAWVEAQPEGLLPDGAVPVPVLELEPRWLRWWSRLMTGGHRAPAAATVLLAADKPRPRVSTYEGAADQTPRQRITEFRSVASPAAQRLAQLLAALPVDLPVAKFVQENFVAESSGPEVLAELISGGLLMYSPDTARSGSTVDQSIFAIAESDREILLEGARRTETARVVRTTAQHHGHRIGGLTLLRDAIADPENTPDPTTQADRALQRLVLRALSGPYLSRANRLDDAPVLQQSGSTFEEISEPVVPDPDPPTPPTLSDIAESENTDMSKAAERADFRDGPAATSATSEIPAPVPVTPTAFTADVGERQPGDGPPVWGPVPPRNLNFTGRDDLIERLHEQLTSGGATVVLPAAIHGMGGIGKTQTAVEYIYRHLDDYDLVWWIPAAQSTQIRSALTELARQLGLPGSSEAHTAVPAVLEALRRGHPVRRWLLVFDAAENPESVRRFFPANGPGEILVTSRNPAWAGVARPLEVSVFRREESVELLRRRGPDITDDEADQLAEKLGDLPLAIEQAAAWRAETGMPVREYLRLFDEKVAEIFDVSSDYEVSVAAAWNLSFDELGERNPAAYQILLICSFFSPEPITRDLFSGVRGLSISPELDVALRDPIQLARAIREINRYGLAKIDHGNNTIQLHRLVQLVLRNRITTPRLQDQMQHGAHQLLANLDPNDPEPSRNWARYRELLPHAYAAEVVNCRDNWVRQLVINLMRFLFQWGDHDEAAKLAREAFDDFTRQLGPKDPQTLEVAWRLGFYLWVLGRFEEAAELNQRTLQLRIEVSGENSEETFGVQTNILADLKAKGDFAGARRLSEELLLKNRRLFGDDDPETLEAAFLHAISLRLTGDFAAARELDEDTYRKRVEILGRDHPNSLSSFVAVVLDRRDGGEYSWARIETEKLVEQAVEQFGTDRMVTQVLIHLLSIARRKDGNHVGAFELSGPVLDNFRRRYGRDHPHTVSCALARSIDLRHAGDLPAALQLGEEAFDSFRLLLGEHHPHTLSATVDLAVTLRLSGDAAGARLLNQRALEQLRASIGAAHVNAVVCGINLASDMVALGEVDAAIELGTEMLGRARDSLGSAHPTTLAAEANLVVDLRMAGQVDTEAQFSDVMARYRRTLGDDHPATIAAARGIRANCDIDPLIL